MLFEPCVSIHQSKKNNGTCPKVAKDIEKKGSIFFKKMSCAQKIFFVTLQPISQPGD
jgi:hypothetical protein